MALIKCTECGKDVSTRASACPHCGCPQTTHRETLLTKEEPAVEHLPQDSLSTANSAQPSGRETIAAQTKVCSYCGRSNLADAVQCRECGTATFKEVQEEAPSTPTTTAPSQVASCSAGSAPTQSGPNKKPDESFGTFLIMIPIASAALAWFWIGNMRLIDGPSSKLGLLAAVTIILTAALVSLEAGRLGFGSDPKRPRSERDSPIVWFFGMVLVWFISYPRYLYLRSRFGARNLIGAGLLSMGIWFASLAVVGYSIATAQENVQRQIQELQR